MWQPAAHLAMDSIQPADLLKEPIAITTNDQFDSQRRLEAYESVMLGVPTFKKKWEAKGAQPA